ncbi:MAG: hypothetical protein IIB42_04635, partial [Candidatus Marinimicrobia bacterium]|nr:hypothetical protein [Candidatus Neomarinimicrobiota bacterium]
AREHFEEALTFDPEYPLALASLAVVKGYYYYIGVDRTPESLQNAEEIATGPSPWIPNFRRPTWP